MTGGEMKVLAYMAALKDRSTETSTARLALTELLKFSLDAVRDEGTGIDQVEGVHNRTLYVVVEGRKFVIAVSGGEMADGRG